MIETSVADSLPGGTKMLAYTDLIGPMVEAIKELKAYNDNLRGVVEAQGREIEALKAAR